MGAGFELLRKRLLCFLPSMCYSWVPRGAGSWPAILFCHPHSTGGAVLRMLHAYFNRDELMSANGSEQGMRRRAALRRQRRLQHEEHEEASGEPHALEGDPFFEGLHSYLSGHKYGSVSYEKLWEHLGEASGERVDELMSTWWVAGGKLRSRKLACEVPRGLRWHAACLVAC